MVATRRFPPAPRPSQARPHTNRDTQVGRETRLKSPQGVGHSPKQPGLLNGPGLPGPQAPGLPGKHAAAGPHQSPPSPAGPGHRHRCPSPGLPSPLAIQPPAAGPGHPPRAASQALPAERRPWPPTSPLCPGPRAATWAKRSTRRGWLALPGRPPPPGRPRARHRTLQGEGDRAPGRTPTRGLPKDPPKVRSAPRPRDLAAAFPRPPRGATPPRGEATCKTVPAPARAVLPYPGLPQPLTPSHLRPGHLLQSPSPIQTWACPPTSPAGSLCPPVAHHFSCPLLATQPQPPPQHPWTSQGSALRGSQAAPLPWGTALIQGPPLPQTPCSRWPSGVPRAEREHYPAGIPSPHSILRRAPGLGQDAPWGPRAAHLPRGPGPNFGPRDGLRNPPRPAGGRPGSPARSGTRPRPRGQRRATGPMLPGPGRRPPSPDLTRVAADTQRPQGQGPIYPRAPGGRHVPDLSFDEETVVSSHSFCSDFQGML